MKISVVVPLYNKANYIVRCITSVLAQTYEDFEVIVVDDGSTDEGVGTLNFVYGSDTRLRVISQANGGVSAARNRGMSEAQGEIIAFLDADDEWMPSHLENIIEAATAYPQVALIGTGYRQLGSKGYVAEITVDSVRPCLLDDYFRMAINRHILTMSSSAMRRSSFEKLGGFEEGEALGEDAEFYARYAVRCPIAYHPKISAIYHNETNTGAVKQFSRNWYANEPLVVRRLMELRNSASRKQLASSLEEYAAHQLYENIVFGIKTGNLESVGKLLEHPLLRHKSVKRKVAWLKRSIRILPKQLIAAYYRLSRSRFVEKSAFRRDGVIVRCISRFSRTQKR